MAEIALINPRRRRKARKTRARKRRHVARRRHTARRRRRTAVVAVRRRNPRRRRHAVVARSRRYRRHRNPRFSVSGIKAALIPAAIGGAGAVALDLTLGYVGDKLPSFLQSGIARTGVKLAGALALGLVAGKAFGSEKGKAVALGGLTVVLYGALRDALKSAAPSLPLSGLSAVDFASETIGAYQPSSLGYMNPAPFMPGSESSDLGAYQTDGM